MTASRPTKTLRLFLQLASAVVLIAATAGLILYFHPLWVFDQQTRFHLRRAGVESKYIVVDGYRLHYFEAAPLNGPPDKPLLLIHGLGDHGESWSPLIPTLVAAGFHIYAPDLLGYGRSDMPSDADYSIDLEEKTVANLMAALHLPRASLIGWSMGGWIAMRLAADHPSLVDRLVLYDSAGVYFPLNAPDDLFTPSDAAGLARLMAILSPHPQVMPDFIARDALRKLHRYSIPVSRSMSSMRDGRNLMDFRLAQIHEPTLIVWGSHDALLPLSTGQRIYEGIPHSNLAVIDTCGHLAPAECARPVLKSTLAFLNSDPPLQGTLTHLTP